MSKLELVRPLTEGKLLLSIFYFDKQGKSLAFTTTKSGDFAELHAVNLRLTEYNLFKLNLISVFRPKIIFVINANQE
jgi:hypothetical protein